MNADFIQRPIAEMLNELKRSQPELYQAGFALCERLDKWLAAEDPAFSVGVVALAMMLAIDLEKVATVDND